MKQKGSTYAVVAILLIAFVWVSYQVKRSEMAGQGSVGGRMNTSPAKSGLISRQAPDFTLASVDGKKVSLAEFRNKNVVLLDFWATWCPPCRAAMPELAELDSKYGGKGLKVISINQGEDAATVAKFVKETGYKPLVLLDDGPTGDKYLVKAIPTLVLIDKAGKVLSVQAGYSLATHSQLEAEICKQLGLKYTPNPKTKGAVRFEHY